MNPFKYADVLARDKNTAIPAYLRIPNDERPEAGWPVLLFICGLDAYRTDNTDRTDLHTQADFATLSLEISGTYDCPAARNDRKSPDGLFSNVLDWITENKAKCGFNDKKIVARGISTGGYYAFRIAQTRADRLLAAFGLGGWSHFSLEPEWIRAMNHMEYPFAIADALIYRLGYQSVEDRITDDPKAKFSLEDNGHILDRSSCPLFVVNGIEDLIFPIEDSILPDTRGRVKP